MLRKKTVVLGVTGSIAAYKAADLVSRLKKLEFNVRVILTDGGARFITPLTLETLSLSPVYTDQFSREAPYEIDHISLAKQADVFLIAPATANFIGKAANGIADDLLTTTYLATSAPVLIAPAMNSAMLSHPAVQSNMRILIERGVHFIAPENGVLACGDEGCGRLANVDVIVKSVLDAISSTRDLEGKRIVVTAGPTREAIDPVRFLSNRSSGKMGFAIAEAASRRGADVLLIAGPVTLPTPPDITRKDVISSAELCSEVNEAFSDCDALIMAAAPADFTIKDVAQQKIKKSGNEGLSISFSPTVDILKSVAIKKTSQLVMGFAAETEALEQNALAKLSRKNLDFIAANDVKAEGVGFATDTNAVTLYYKNGMRKESGLMQKRDLADWLLGALITEWKAQNKA